MDMIREDVIFLIEMYQEKNLLWNPKNPHYHNKKLKDDAWKEIANMLQKTMSEVKQKMASLLGSYRRERKKVKDSLGTGRGLEEIYKSDWFGYPYFYFLHERDAPKGSINTVEVQQSNRVMTRYQFVHHLSKCTTL
ncbi:uncharacterized protein LOC113367047 [Ctenocephalides felis]|uniref:uncharacterized protein LOC113367047 n=1 Tax=Ctenocephalides felis TaxID=7515 RepID=UPI000E6E59BD|nr:uncharacterized protein LOC113367047 [Ctenocephalides felis]